MAVADIKMMRMWILLGSGGRGEGEREEGRALV